MIPLTPKSVKMTREMSARIRKDAQRLGYSDNQFIVNAVEGIFDIIEKHQNATVPKMVHLIWTARRHEAKTMRLFKVPKRSGKKIRRFKVGSSSKRYNNYGH